MTEQELRESVANKFYYFDHLNDRDYIHWSDCPSEHKEVYLFYADEVLSIIKEAGYVQLAEDQRLPSSGEVVLLDAEPFKKGYHLGQLRMVETGWRKVGL